MVAGPFRRLSMPLRVIVVVLLTVGVAGFVVGLLGDFRGWWDQLGFVGNVLAGVTGAGFGIPFAVLVVGELIRSSTTAQASETSASRLVLDLTMLGEMVADLESGEQRQGFPGLDTVAAVRRQLARVIEFSAPEWERTTGRSLGNLNPGLSSRFAE